MKKDVPEESNPRLSATSIHLIESLIAEADMHIRSNPVRLRELATEIGDRSAAIGYNRGIFFAGFYAGCALYLQSQFEEAGPYFLAALDGFRGLQDRGGTVSALRYLGLAHHSLCRYEQALEYYREELYLREQHFRDDSVGAAGARANIATLYLLMGQHDIALQSYLHVLALLGNREEDRIYTATMSNIANVYMALEDYDRALEYQNRVLEIYRKNGDEIGEANTLLNLSWNHMHCGRGGQALDCSTGAFVLFEKQGNIKKQAVALLYSGQAYFRLQQYGEALDFCRRSYVISYTVGDKKNCMDVFRTMGDILSATEDNELAKEYYTCALELARETKMRQMEYELCEQLAGMEERMGNAESALRLYREYVQVKEEVLDEHRRQAISEMQLHFNVEQSEKAKEIYRLRNIELANALEEVELLNRDLSDASNEKDELISVVAYDLKTPISNLARSLAVLGTYPAKLSRTELMPHIDTMQRTVQRMERMVSRLLVLNFLDSGGRTLYPDAINLEEAIRSVVEHHGDRLEEKGIAVQYRLLRGLWVYADNEALCAVIENLVANAIEYSVPGTAVAVRTSRTGGIARLEVHDTGLQIDPADYNKVFGKFARRAVSTGAEHSIGLGLSIVKRLVEAMNGRIWCENGSDGGVVFSVELSAVYGGEEGEND